MFRLHRVCLLVIVAGALTGGHSAISQTKNPADQPVRPAASGALQASKSAGADANHPYGYHLQPILEKIKATNGQRQKITQIVVSYRCRIEPLHDEYQQSRQEFINEMTSGACAEQIIAKQSELSHLSSEITSRYTLMHLEIRRLLSPEQIVLFEEYSKEQGWKH